MSNNPKTRQNSGATQPKKPRGAALTVADKKAGVARASGGWRVSSWERGPCSWLVTRFSVLAAQSAIKPHTRT